MSRNIDEIWGEILDLVKAEMTEQTFTTWFNPIVPLKLKNTTITIQVPNQFFYEFIDKHYGTLLENAIKQVLGTKFIADFSVAVNQQDEIPKDLSVKKIPSVELDDKSQLNERYIFENFVEGNSNQFAKAASLAVAEAPGKTSFNPLVIYGGVGLGKTHLIQAVGNHIRIKDPSKKILYVSSEKFTIEFIESVQRNRMKEFSNIYRLVDILIVDDIHFFINKERTQEEFFHTFNTLHHKGKQIIMSSDRPPKDLKGMEERLLSRFQWGLVVDIQPPDLETRIAILQKKAEENGIELENDIVELFAQNIISNIRELEGALIRLLAKSSLDSQDINMDLAKGVLKDLRLNKKQNLSIEEMQRIVAAHFGIPEDMLRAKTRKKEIVYARQVCMFLSKYYTKHSLKTIGLHFGGRDHSTVIHANHTIEELVKSDKQVKEDINALKRKIEIASL
ncbi:MAG: chromosomal replication initiator protein DnaA [candidate division KSB1 bacterium]|jgi:chromosomal replication initiator protein|nr:chromosomal replication initiator protein DnaA [candidate division KSB1 bacterium]